MIGSSSATQKITLKNTGGAPLTMSGITVAGTGATSFAQSNNCGISVAASGSCTITVTFTPKATGSLTATVNITDNAAGSPHKVSLTGTGTAPLVTLTPAALTFSGTLVNTAATKQTITLKNTGTAALTISGISITGAGVNSFSQTTTCSANVAVSATCTISVTFKPATTGSLAAKVSIADNATGSPQTVSLAGAGTAPAVSLTPNSLTFGDTTVKSSAVSQKITLKNTGTAALSLTGITMIGTNAASFSQTNTCGASLAVSGTCIITVGFKPTAAGSLAASVKVADSAANSPQTAVLTGKGK